MKELCEKLEEIGFPLSKAHAVEVFARQGDWHTIDYSDKVASVEAWEIDDSHFPELRKNLPEAEIKQVDSIEYIRRPENRASADLVVIDNPQNTFGENNEYCEHFDVIDPALELLRPGGVVIFNVNIEPFDYEKFPDWRSRREEFYGQSETSQLSVDGLLKFYKQRFNNLGYRVKVHLAAKRTGYLHYLAYQID
jgi:16S rRNA G966 N2-methylase RsmD